MTKTDRRRSCMYGCMSDARARLHFLGILFRRSDARFERQLRETNRGRIGRPPESAGEPAVSEPTTCTTTPPALTTATPT